MKVLARLFGLAVLALLLWVGWKWIAIRSEEVQFQSGSLTLRGTLLAPRFGSKSPAVVLVHGSGSTSRKSTIAYAWIFASQGYAALAYDKRGVGKSDGGSNEWKEFHIEDLASDAAEAFRFLQSHAVVDPKRIGFFGASQGGWVVSLAANRVPAPAFLIMVSASVSTIAEDRIFGREAQLRHAGFGRDEVDQATKLLLLDHQVTRSGQQYADLLAAWNRYRGAAWFREVYGASEPLAVEDPHRQWERSVLDFDPQPLLKTIQCPVLWVFGDPAIDRFSPVKLSVDRMRAARASGARYEVIQIDGAGHTLEGGNTPQTLFQIRLPLIRKMFSWLRTTG